MPELFADTVRGHCPRNGTFPPPTIYNWVRWETVSLDRLAEELRYWADYYAAQIDGDGGAG